MTLQQLRYLLAIADSGLNITAAADRLHTSQPGISKQLKQLEQELSVQLFTRKGKSLAEITPAGREVINRARKIVREADNIRSLARNLSGEQEGTLSIGTTHTQARYVLPEIIREFRERFPKVKLELHQGTSEQIAELVAHNRLDFAIASGGQHLFPELVLLPCYHWDRIVLAPREHPINQLQGQLDLQTLVQHPLITYVFSVTGESSFKRAFAEHDLEPDVVFTARDADIIKTYVRMGMGVGVVAGMAYECQDERDLAALDATGLFPRVTTWIGYRRDAVLRDYMREFVYLFAPHISREILRDVGETGSQQEIDALLADIALPLRGGCGSEIADAA